MTEEDYDDLLMFEDSDRYTDREKAALRYTSAVLWDSSIADEKLWAELHSHFTEPELVELGWVHPNPAIQNNRCHSYLARDVVRVGEPEPDPNEAFELERVPLEAIPGLIREGKITHSLVVTAFHLYGLR